MQAAFEVGKGWHVVPIQRGSKHPGSIVGKNWQTKTSDDPAKIEHWINEQHNLGLLLGPKSGIIDIEYDNDEGKRIVEEWLGGLVTPTYRSAKSTHRLFVYDDRFINEKSHVLINGTEWRFGQDSAQSVIPPSVHETGVQYVWYEGLSPADCEPMPLPDEFWQWYLDNRDKETVAQAPAVAYREFANQDTLINRARAFAEQHYDWSRLLSDHGWGFIRSRGDAQDWRRPGKSCGTSATLNFNGSGTLRVFTSSTQLQAESSYDKFAYLCLLEHGNDPIATAKAILPPNELDDVNRIWQATQQLPEVDLSFLDKPTAKPTAAPPVQNNNDFPAECLRPPGLLTEIIDYTLARSMYPQPILAVAGALALLATITGRKVRTEYGTRTNIYLVGLAPSGAGKEQARKTNKEILAYSGAEHLIGPERLASSAGLTSFICDRLSPLFQIDEVGRLLATMKSAAKSPHLFNIGTVLMQIYTSSDVMWIGDAYADMKKTPKANQPHPVLYGTAVPESFWCNMTKESMGDGLLGRMMIFEAAGYVSMQRPKLIELPTSIISSVTWWIKYEAGTGNLARENPTPFIIKYTQEALSRFDSHVAAINERRTHECYEVAALWSRAGEKVSKLAMLFAISRQRETDQIEISIDDVNLAIRLSNWLTRRMLVMAGEHISANDLEADKKRLLRMIKGRMRLNELTRKSQWLRTRDRVEYLNELESMGLIKMEIEDTSGRPVTYVERLADA